MKSKNDASPDIVEGPSVFSSGGRRLNRVPLIILFTVLFVAISALFYAYQQRVNDDKRTKERAEEQDLTASSSDANILFKNAPSRGLIPPKKAEPPVSPQTTNQSSVTNPSGDSNETLPEAENPELAEERQKAWALYKQQQHRIQQQKHALLESALSADTTVYGNKPQSERGASAQTNVPSIMSGSNGMNPLQGFGGEGADESGSHNENWIRRNAPGSNPYLASRKMPPISQYEVKAGTVIPGVMVTGINSDLPGTITAQVRENVYDSTTGHYLLIPQGAKLIGQYNSRVIQGQKRVLTGWERIIYPDGSSIDIGRMAGGDAAGYSGFHDKVDSRYWENIGNALMLSIFSAGIQLSQPQATAGENINSQQIIAASIGQQLGELGAEYARKGLNTAPTLEIRPGYRFNIVVTKDMILSPLGI